MSHHFLSEVKRLENQPHHPPHASLDVAGDCPENAETPINESPIIDVEYTSSPEPASPEEPASLQPASTHLDLDKDPNEPGDSDESPDSEGTSEAESAVASTLSVDTDYAQEEQAQESGSDPAESDSVKSNGLESDAVVVTVVSEAIPHGDKDDEQDNALTQVNEELAAVLQREEGLKTRVQDLERQVAEEREQVEKLRLDLEIVTASKKELLADLAEAKRYILHLTEPQPAQPSTNDQGASVDQSSPSSEKGSDGVNRGVGRSPQPSSPISRSRRPQPSPSASSRVKGLPPMSTEQLHGLPPMSSERLASSTPTPSNSSPKALPYPSPSRSPRPSSRPPLTLPERKPSQSAKSAPDSLPEQQDDGQTPTGSNGKGAGLSTVRRSPLRPMSRGDRPIPEAARDTHKKVPEPKLTNSEISWFD